MLPHITLVWLPSLVSTTWGFLTEGSIPHITCLLIVWLSMCIDMCFFRFIAIINCISQMSHLYGFSCMHQYVPFEVTTTSKLFLRDGTFVWILPGLCVNMCLFKYPVQEKFITDVMSHVYSFSCACIHTYIYLLRFPLWVKSFSQISHLWGFCVFQHVLPETPSTRDLFYTDVTFIWFLSYMYHFKLLGVFSHIKVFLAYVASIWHLSCM